VRIGPHRRFAAVRADLEDLRLVKNTFGGTVNDVVLAAVAGGLAHWLHGRGVALAGLEPRAGVPVSIRSDDERGTPGNRIAQVVAPLPVSVRDPVERLQAVRAAMGGVKDSRQALGAEVISSLQGFAPPTILAQASRLNFSSRFYNLLVTNIPGPQVPLYLLGRRLEELFPVPFLVGDRALAVAVMSYDGTVGFGLLADLDALPDVQTIADGISASLAELVTRAGGGPPGGFGLRPSPRRRSAKRPARER
jgi:WS/DGAT/MGAT family acyltransferase